METMRSASSRRVGRPNILAGPIWGDAGLRWIIFNDQPGAERQQRTACQGYSALRERAPSASLKIGLSAALRSGPASAIS